MRELRLGRNVVELDDADFDLVLAFEGWEVVRGRVIRRVDKWHVPMTNQILQLPLSRHVYHLDGDPLNLQRANLRIDARRSGLPANNTSGFRGVRWHRGSNRWEVQVSLDRRQQQAGYYVHRLEAAFVRDEKIREAGLEVRHPNLTESDFEFLRAAKIWEANNGN